MQSKIVIILGIGRDTALELARHGATLHLLCRNAAKAEQLADDIREETGTDHVSINHFRIDKAVVIVNGGFCTISENFVDPNLLFLSLNDNDECKT